MIILVPIVDEFWIGYHVDSYAFFMWYRPDILGHKYVAKVKCMTYEEDGKMNFYRDGFCIFSMDCKEYYKLLWEFPFAEYNEWECEAKQAEPPVSDLPIDAPLW